MTGNRNMTRRGTLMKAAALSVALVLAASLSAALCGCSCVYDPYSGFSFEQNNGQYDVTGGDTVEPVAEWFLNAGSFEYEKALARFYYKGGEYPQPADSDRQKAVRDRGTYDFNEEGRGVIAVTDPAADDPEDNVFYIEYTSDCGETWSIYDGAFRSRYYAGDVRVNGDMVYIVRRSLASMDSYIMYSDDMCGHFEQRDIVSMLPEYQKALRGRTVNLRILSIDSGEDSIVLGWYDMSEYSGSGVPQEKYFLIVRCDSRMTMCRKVYADGKYINDTKNGG